MKVEDAVSVAPICNGYVLFFQTLLNQQGLYVATVLPAYVILLLSAGIAFNCAGGSFTKLKDAVLCKRLRASQ